MPYSYFLLADILFLFLVGCNKKENTAAIDIPANNYTTQRYFNSADSVYAGWPLSFMPDLMSLYVSGNTYFWEFGDGETSTKELPDHIYRSPGRYTVIMTLNNNPNNRAQKVVRVLQYDGFYYSDKLKGTRHWEGTNAYNSGDKFPVSDTFLTIEMIDSGIVKLNGYQLSFLYGSAEKREVCYSDRGRATLYYYSKNDSISYSYTWQSTVGHGGQTLSLHTK